MFKHLVILCSLVGCAVLQGKPKSFVIKDIEASLGDIRSAVVASFPIGSRSVSSNGREMVSKHFLISGNGSVRPAGDALERYFAQITILGDRRPYNVEIVVAHEKRVLRGENFTYVIDYYDTVLARDISRKLEEELAKRREDRNIIDDFRVF